MIKLENVRSVYSGRPGCCCGCRGKHTYASAYRKASEKYRGYKIDDDEVNDAVVRRHVKRINAAIEAGEKIVLNEVYVAYETPNHIWIAYLVGS